MRKWALFPVLGLLLSACGLIPSAKDKIFTAEPKSGDCWQATMQQANDWLDWRGFAPVDCSEKHTMETVEVSAVEGDFPGTGLGGADEYSDEFKQAASQTCSESWSLASEGLKRPYRIMNFFFIPSPEDFATGARWVRCDIGVFATGTPWDDSSLEFQILEKSLDKFAKNAFQLCLDSATDEIGEGGSNLKVADCDEPHRWQMVRANDVSLNATEKYPGAEEVNARSRTTCNFKKPRSVTGWFWQNPSQEQWETGFRTSYCWWAQAQPAKI